MGGSEFFASADAALQAQDGIVPTPGIDRSGAGTGRNPAGEGSALTLTARIADVASASPHAVPGDWFVVVAPGVTVVLPDPVEGAVIAVSALTVTSLVATNDGSDIIYAPGGGSGANAYEVVGTANATMIFKAVGIDGTLYWVGLGDGGGGGGGGGGGTALCFVVAEVDDWLPAPLQTSMLIADPASANPTFQQKAAAAGPPYQLAAGTIATPQLAVVGRDALSADGLDYNAQLSVYDESGSNVIQVSVGGVFAADTASLNVDWSGASVSTVGSDLTWDGSHVVSAAGGVYAAILNVTTGAD